MSVTQQFKDLVQGKTRMLSDKELAERDFEGFFAWLKDKGVSNPYYYYPKEAWALWRFQRDYGAYVQEQQAKAQAEQQRSGLIQALKDPAKSRTAILAAVMGWELAERETLIALIFRMSHRRTCWRMPTRSRCQCHEERVVNPRGKDVARRRPTWQWMYSQGRMG